jgi:WD40 repeat protein
LPTEWGVSCIGFSPDGEKLAAGGCDGQVRLWNVQSGQERPQPPGHVFLIDGVAFARDGRMVATLGNDRTLRLWDVATSRQLRCLRLSREKGARMPCCSLAISPDCQTVFARATPDTVGAWDTRTGARRQSYCHPSDEVYSFAVSPDGQLLAVEAYSHEPAGHWLRLWEVGTGQLRRSFAIRPPDQAVPAGSKAKPHRCAFSPDGRLVASVSSGTSIHLWDVATGAERQIVGTHPSGALSLAFAPSGQTLVSCGGECDRHQFPRSTTWNDDRVRFWDVATGRALGELVRPLGNDGDLLWSADGGLLCTPLVYGKGLSVWEANTGQELLCLKPPGDDILVAAFSPSGLTVFTGMKSGAGLLWSLDPAAYQQIPAPKVTADNLARWWAELASEDAVVAYRAVWLLAAAAQPATTFLAERLRPIREPKRERLEQLITDLDDAKFVVREAASKELERLGCVVEPALRRALTAGVSLETRARLQPLLTRWCSWRVTDGDTLRALRALWVLERIGTPAARQILNDVAHGAPGVRVTDEADAACRRLDRRPGRN